MTKTTPGPASKKRLAIRFGVPVQIVSLLVPLSAPATSAMAEDADLKAFPLVISCAY